MPIYSDITQFIETQNKNTLDKVISKTVVNANVTKAPEGTYLNYDLDSICESIYNIITTKKGERIFLPDFGNELDDILFEPISPETALQLYRRLIYPIEKWEKRIKIDYNKTVIKPNVDYNTYDVTLVFSIVGLQDKQFTYQVSLGEGA